jgi:hypothetical protein
MSEPAILTVDDDAWVPAVMTRVLRHHDGIGPLGLGHSHLATV